MEYVIAIYRSRNVSMRAYNYLQNKGITCALISTPRAANVGCGLSVKFAKNVLREVRGVLSSGETFVGFYLVKITLNGSTLSRI
ncbi:MAG: DUF3343 domain-containing protein [Corallococcus sp.]|nr:DUF3343 domain-containing protein [Bacillota bacterium]MCM1533634.1 DUF3343 domain-containing protein [Corallococcus sp.]